MRVVHGFYGAVFFLLLGAFFSTPSFAVPNFTQKMIEIITRAREIAGQMRSPQVTPQHILKAMVEHDDVMTRSVLKKGGIDVEGLSLRIDQSFAKTPVLAGGPSNPPLSSEAVTLLNRAEAIQTASSDQYCSTEHMLSALEEAPATSRIMHDSGLSNEVLQRSLSETKGETAPRITSPDPESGLDPLRRYCVDITAKARRNEIPPVVGRDEEIDRVVDILGFPEKGNPTVVGEPGVGKTAVVEGLAQRIAHNPEGLPVSMRSKRIMSLDVGAMTAGSSLRGAFEERVKSVLDAAKADPDVILFIDEMHTVVGAGKAEGSADLANLLKPALSRGEIHVIGATTLDEYRKHIEKDGALARRFPPVYVNATNEIETVRVLRGRRGYLETHHGVEITDDALVYAARYSERYIPNAFNPDKSMDVVNEAFAIVKRFKDSPPIEIRRNKTRMDDIEFELERLRRQDSAMGQLMIRKLETELNQLRETNDVLLSNWREGMKIREAMKTLEKEQADLVKQQESLRNQQRFSEVAEVEGKLTALKERVKLAQTAFNDALKVMPSLSEKVDKAQIAMAIERIRGINASDITGDEAQRLLNMETEIAKRVIGQPEAIHEVAQAVRRRRSGFGDRNRPMGTFIFSGDTGLGKTLLSKQLAKFLFGDEDAVIRLDGGGFKEANAVTRLIGSPPGYHDHDEGGQLTEKVRRRPYSVVLLDEAEKAHRDVFNTFLTATDEGFMMDSFGRKIDFRNTIVIMTTNLTDKPNKDGHTLRSFFSPEFLGRTDGIIEFKHLGAPEMREIMKIHLKPVEQQAMEQGVRLNVSERALDYLTERSVDGEKGGRDYKDAIQKGVIDPLSNLSLQGQIPIDHEVIFDIEDSDEGPKLRIDFKPFDCDAEVGKLAS